MRHDTHTEVGKSRMRAQPLWTAALLCLNSACGGVSDGPFGEGSGGEATGGGAQGGGAQGGGAQGGAGQGGQGGQGTSGASITIRFRSSTAPFAHADGLSGQTPIAHSSGVRKLQLFKGQGDPTPLTVFDFGSDFVEISYDDGADTVVHTAAVDALAEGTYTLARVVHSHVRYQIAATMHGNALALPGSFANLQVLSDGTMIDGTLRNHGYYEYVFTAGGADYPATGNNAPLPLWPDTGGFSVTFEQGEWAYTFPVYLVISHDLAEDVDVVHRVNMFESFRWQDQSYLNYQPGVFDTTATESEPVMHFGANSFDVTVE